MTKSRYMIGLTGNIATGKSIVRGMLTNLGAMGIDADHVAHRMLYPSGLAYQPVVEAFGKQILDENGRISRQKLGKIVFNQPDKLAQLENIVHPTVSQSIQILINRTPASLIAVEAIKLFEAGLDAVCQSVWVSHIPEAVQMERLLQIRKMSREAARTRITSQPPQTDKLARADVVINTGGTFRYTWEQVESSLHDTIHSKPKQKAGFYLNEDWHLYNAGSVLDDSMIEFFHQSKRNLDLFHLLGIQQMAALKFRGALDQFVLWENWNFTGTLTTLLPKTSSLQNPEILLKAFEHQACQQGCEVLLIADDMFLNESKSLQSLGYTKCQPEILQNLAWRKAAEKCRGDSNQPVWVKVLAQPFETQVIIGNERA